METSILVARMFAVVYIVVGIGMVLNAAYFKKVFDGMWKESGMIVLGGMMSLLAGFLLVTYHNLWVKDWTVVITVFEDRSFTFIIKSPPCSVLLKRACGIAKASGVPNKDKVGAVTKAQVKEIAQMKMKDLNTDDVEKAMKIVAGTARSMGIDVVEKAQDIPKPEAESQEEKQ